MKKRILTTIGMFFARLASLMTSTATMGWTGEPTPPKDLLK